VIYIQLIIISSADNEHSKPALVAQRDFPLAKMCTGHVAAEVGVRNPGLWLVGTCRLITAYSESNMSGTCDIGSACVLLNM